MRKQYILSVLIALLPCMSIEAQQKEFSGKIHVTPLSLEQRGDSVYVRLSFDISGVNVDSRKSISLIPALVSGEERSYFTEVMVKGRENYRVHQREVSLMNKRQKSIYDAKAPYVILKGFKAGNSKKLDYTQAIKYEPWMADATLDIYEDLCGCGNPVRRMGVSQLASLGMKRSLEAYEVIPLLSYVKPAVEEIKQREITGEAYLDFVVNQSQIRPDYMNNPAELRKITDLVQRLKSDPDVKVKTINVAGYASPEGKIANNRELSEKRALSLVQFLYAKFDYSRDIYSLNFGGENWDGLKQRVEASDMPYRQQVLDIIESVPEEINYVTNTSRKKALMDLGGGMPYRYMLKEFFPSLRKAVCHINFEVKSFNVEQAREVVKSSPQNLSLSEMFLVANSYEKGSPEFIDLFEVAVKLFPNDTTAILNAALAALERKDKISAERYLATIEGKTFIPEYYNAVGALFILKGKPDKAAEYFNEAANMGLKEAMLNLEKVATRK